MKDGDEEIELVAEPHTMLVMLNSRWEYSYTPSGEALALQTFMLTEPAIYCLEETWGADEIQGNMESLTGQSSGPPPPPGEQVRPRKLGASCWCGMLRWGLDQGCWDAHLASDACDQGCQV
eukprot:Skav225083  [mRNA]  locus=scaffold1341:16517:17702:- [translate_table: standard]